MTYFRILLVPVFVIVYLKTCALPSIWERLWPLAVIALSAATDVFDGIVARKTGQVTDLGKILDPVADKAMQFAMMFCVIINYPLVLMLIIIFAAKELISLAFSSYLLAHGKHIGGAMWCGKICTVILYSVMFVFVVLPDIKHPIDTIMICISGAFMLLAFIVYISSYLKLLAELRQEVKESQEV